MVSVVEPSSTWNSAGAATAAGAATGLAATARAVVAPPPLTIVVAGLAEATAGLATALAATTAPAAGTATGTPPAAGFATGKLPPVRTAAAGRLGLTVMRAVSLGGGLLMMEVPVLEDAPGIAAGAGKTGFIGTVP